MIGSYVYKHQFPSHATVTGHLPPLHKTVTGHLLPLMCNSYGPRTSLTHNSYASSILPNTQQLWTTYLPYTHQLRATYLPTQDSLLATHLSYTRQFTGHPSPSHITVVLLPSSLTHNSYGPCTSLTQDNFYWPSTSFTHNSYAPPTLPHMQQVRASNLPHTLILICIIHILQVLSPLY